MSSVRSLFEKRSSGFSVVEIVVAAAIVAFIVVGVASAWQFYIKLTGKSVRLAQASLLLEEGAEAMIHLRNESWTSNIATLNTTKTYYLIWNGTDYTATTTPTLINNTYYRTLTVASVYRDSSSNITASGGTLDTGTINATLTIYPATTTASAILSGNIYVFNEFSN